MSGRRVRVAVIFGGRSTEHAISCVSAGSVLGALDREQYEVIPVGITPKGGWVLPGGDPEALQITGRALPHVDSGTAVVLPADPTAGGLVVVEPGEGARVLDSVDVVFPLLHGAYGEDGTIQGLLEMAGVPYVGSGVLASAVAMDKEFAKKLLRADGLPVGDYAVLRPGQAPSEVDLSRLGMPVFVKPARAGSSVGITKVSSPDGLGAAIAGARNVDPKVLIEAAVPGREIECGVLEGLAGGPPEASVPAEIRLVRGHDWYDFEAKYLDDACEFDVPADLPAGLTDRIRELACRVFTALDCAGLARVDFFVTPDGEPVVNEVNTMPGFTSISMFPKVWAATGLDYPSLLDRLIRTAIRRGSGLR
ncbi:MAG TPA: D-alanine--D-alanine ligase family protein [Mycobacteriales bacterium]|nr:D-alanine--D-alanine ligase family protein [Mycobacteriales bacterium]